MEDWSHEDVLDWLALLGMEMHIQRFQFVELLIQVLITVA
jgi:hypothetical protein